MSTRSRLSSLAIAGAWATLLVAPVAAAEDGAHVRVLHGSPDAPEVNDAYVNDAKVDALSGLGFGDLTDYVAVPAGTYAIKVCATADASICPIDVPELALADGQEATRSPQPTSRGIHQGPGPRG